MQVGNWSLESQYWGTYEPLTAQTMPRPGYNVSTADGAADLAGSMAAAFAASAVVFKQSDPAYSARLQDAAETLYTGVSRLTQLLVIYRHFLCHMDVVLLHLRCHLQAG